MKKILLMIVPLLILVLGGCGPTEVDIAEAIRKTEAARPTEMPTPTEIPVPTETPLPTATATPASTPTREYCNASEVVRNRDALLPIVDEYIQIFDRGSRITATTQFSLLKRDLGDIQTRLDKIDFAPCMQDTVHYLSESMRSLHEGFDAAIEEDFETGILKTRRASDFLGEATDELVKVIDCLPNCRP